MNSQPPTKLPVPRQSSPLLLPLVLIALLLAAGMVFTGLRLSDHMTRLSIPALNADEAVRLIDSTRQLMVVLALVSLAFVLLLGWAFWVFRRESRERESADQQTRRQIRDLEIRLKQQTIQLEQSRARLEALLSHTTEGVIFSADDRIASTNRAFARLTGYTDLELSGRPLEAGGTGIHIERELGRLHATISEAIARGGIWQGPFMLHTRDGRELDVAVIGAPVNGSAGRHTITLFRDSSREKQLQAQKTRFVSNASHELRTPLANLKTRVYLLRKQPEKLEEHLQVMEDVTSYMQQLLDEMLEIGRFERGTVMLERETAALQDLINEAVASYRPRAERRAIALASDLPAEPIMVLVDQRRIIQVITNLISNAMNHTQQGGQVDVRLRASDGELGRHVARIEVQDNGIGIPDELLAQIFQPFSTASQGLVTGTVLGLSLAKEIIELHSGEITARSEVGKGSLFTVTLPIVQT